MIGLFLSFAGALNGVFLPRLSKLNAARDFQGMLDELVKLVRIQAIVLGFIFFAFLLFGKAFLVLWAGQEYVNLYSRLALMLFSAIIISKVSLGIAYLQAKNDLRIPSILYFSTLLISIILQYILVDDMGINGVILGVLLPLFAGPVVGMLLIFRKKVLLDWRNLGLEVVRVYSVNLGLVISLLFCLEAVDMNVIGTFVVMCVVYIGLFGLINWKLILNEEERKYIRSSLQ